jgi:hypothetical protein
MEGMHVNRDTRVCLLSLARHKGTKPTMGFGGRFSPKKAYVRLESTAIYFDKTVAFRHRMRPSKRVKPRLPQPSCHRTRRESPSPGKSDFISSCEERQSHVPSAVATGYIYAYILWTEAHGKRGCDTYVPHADLRMWIRTGEVDIEILPQRTKV